MYSIFDLFFTVPLAAPADSPTRAAAAVAAGRMATKTAAAPAAPTRHVSMTEAMAKEVREGKREKRAGLVSKMHSGMKMVVMS